MFADEPTDSEEPAGRSPTHNRTPFEFLLQVIRYWLSRGMSFTEIEETLVAAGIAPGPAEQIVELVIQDLHGRVRPPGGFPDVDVPPAALAALGFAPDEPATRDAVPELSFAQPTDATQSRVARAHGAHRLFVVGVLALVALLGAGAILVVLRAVR